MHPLVARCHLGLGELFGGAGRVPDAKEHLATALAMFTDMAMAHWSEKANRALSALDAPARGRRAP